MSETLHTHCFSSFTCNHTGSERYYTIVSAYFAEGIKSEASCDDVFIIWNQVSEAELYRLEFVEEDGDILYNATTKTILFIISLSDPLFKEKSFSVKVNTISNSMIQILIIKAFFADWCSFYCKW